MAALVPQLCLPIAAEMFVMMDGAVAALCHAPSLSFVDVCGCMWVSGSLWPWIGVVVSGYLWGFVGDVSEYLWGCVISVSVHVFVCISISLLGLFWVSLNLYISESLGVCASQHPWEYVPMCVCACVDV